MRFQSAVSVLFCLVMLAIAGGRARAEMIDGIVAVVDDTIIMVSDLEERMEELDAPKNNKNAERQVLELMVEDIVVKKIYDSLGLPPVGEDEAEDLVKKSGMSRRDAESYIRKAALMDMMVRSRVVVTENMIRNYYESQEQYRGKESVHLNQILIRRRGESGQGACRAGRGPAFCRGGKAVFRCPVFGRRRYRVGRRGRPLRRGIARLEHH